MIAYLINNSREHCLAYAIPVEVVVYYVQLFAIAQVSHLVLMSETCPITQTSQTQPESLRLSVINPKIIAIINGLIMSTTGWLLDTKTFMNQIYWKSCHYMGLSCIYLNHFIMVHDEGSDLVLYLSPELTWWMAPKSWTEPLCSSLIIGLRAHLTTLLLELWYSYQFQIRRDRTYNIQKYRCPGFITIYMQL